MRQWAGRLRALLPELERPIIALEGAESLDLAVNDLAEAGVAELPPITQNCCIVSVIAVTPPLR